MRLSDGNEIQAAAVGNSRDEAIDHLLALDDRVYWRGKSH